MTKDEFALVMARLDGAEKEAIDAAAGVALLETRGKKVLSVDLLDHLAGTREHAIDCARYVKSIREIVKEWGPPPSVSELQQAANRYVP